MVSRRLYSTTDILTTSITVFKVYQIEEDKFKEICNLRASKQLNLIFSCNDVSWSSTDGKIFGQYFSHFL